MAFEAHGNQAPWIYLILSTCDRAQQAVTQLARLPEPLGALITWGWARHHEALGREAIVCPQQVPSSLPLRCHL